MLYQHIILLYNGNSNLGNSILPALDCMLRDQNLSVFIISHIFNFILITKREGETSRHCPYKSSLSFKATEKGQLFLQGIIIVQFQEMRRN